MEKNTKDKWHDINKLEEKENKKKNGKRGKENKRANWKIAIHAAKGKYVVINKRAIF